MTSRVPVNCAQGSQGVTIRTFLARASSISWGLITARLSVAGGAYIITSTVYSIHTRQYICYQRL